MTHEELERGARVKLILNIACRHRQFIKIGEKTGEEITRQHSEEESMSGRSRMAVTPITACSGGVCQFVDAALTLELLVYVDGLPQSALTPFERGEKCHGRSNRNEAR